MENVKRLPLLNNVDIDAQCLYRYVYGAEDIFNPHCHTFYEIFITISGTVTHLINGVTQKLPEGSLVFIRPDDVHGYLYDTPQSTNTAYVNLTFTHETMTQLFSYLSDSFPSKKLLSCDMPPTVLLNRIEKKRVLSQINELNSVNWKDKNALKLRMRSLLCEIFVRFFSDTQNQSVTSIPIWLSQLLSDMERPENFLCGSNRMVELSQKTREHLSRCMKKYFGLSVTEYINELKINYASNLLLRSNTPIISICYDSGFQNVSHFNRIFKKEYGISPREFRNLYK